jgi:hypothetical protein
LTQDGAFFQEGRGSLSLMINGRFEMGSLIMTKGTKRLIAHYNDEFDTWIQFYRGLINNFIVNSTDVWTDIIQNAAIVDAASPGNGHAPAANAQTLLPPPHPKHAHLILRWQFFLQNVLSKSNNTKLAKGVHDALADNNVVYIIFDVVHDDTQDVVVTPDTDNGDSIYRITIHTVAMRKHPKTTGGQDPVDIDP